MRLQGYDYSRSGLYFLTIVVQNRLHLFGEIHPNGHPVLPVMILNDAGNMVEKWYHEIENKFPDKRCHQMVVMPNHFHCIIENMEMPTTNRDAHVPPTDAHVPHNDGRPHSNDDNPKYGIHNKRYGTSIGDVMDWFKTMTTNEYIRGVKNNHWRRFDGKLWQRNYYDHIIRNDHAFQKISHYIINNPLKWNDDTFNNDNNQLNK
jgi:REP element-mobilizing transposase RayT